MPDAHASRPAFMPTAGMDLWIDPPSDLREVHALIRSLSPVAITRPLIRIGGDGDGGYLLPDDLDGITSVISPGVSTEVGFDLALAERGMEVHQADASVAGPPVAHPRFRFHPRFLDVFEDARHMRLDTLCATAGKAGDRLLQMDIEGGEYPVLLDTSDAVLQSFRIMVIEFHNLDGMLATFLFRMIRATFQKLLRFHQVVHIHPNNTAVPRRRGGIEIPPVMEFTFYRKDRVQISPDRPMPFPHPLDRDNVPHMSGLPLPACWRP